MKKPVLALLALLAVCPFASAAPGDGDLLNLLRKSDAVTKLGIGGETLLNINKLLGELDGKVLDLLNKAKPDIKVGGFSVGKAPDPMNMVGKIQNEFRGQVMKLLSTDQLGQAFKLGVQAEGNFAFLMPEVAKQIKLDRNAVKAIEGYRGDYNNYAKDLVKQVAAGKISEADKLKLLADKDAALQTMIAQVVKPEQLEALKTLAKD